MPAQCVNLPLAGGLVCSVPDSNTLLTPFVLREQGDWFEDEIRFVRRLVRPGDEVIDIGANYGTYTLTMAALVGATGRVHAFEPASQPISMLERSLKTNRFDHVTLHESGLSDHVGTASLAISANPELNSLDGGQQDDAEEIDLTTLDAVLGGYTGRISFVKMDAEGEEERILAGAARFLAEQDPLIMFELRHGIEINEGLCEAFMRRGFLIFRLVPGPGVLAPIPLGEPLDGFLLNAFAVRPGREAALQAAGLLVPLRIPLPETAGQVRVQEFIDALAASPWLAADRPSWQPDAAIPGWDEQRRAVALARLGMADGLSAADRVACLRHALRGARKALAAGVTGSRLFTAARIALDLGLRGEAVRHLGALTAAVMDGQDLTATFKEPFLLPDRHHESVHGLALGELVKLAVLETYAWRSAFSAYFAMDKLLPLYERIVELPRHAERSRVTLELLRSVRRPGNMRL